MLLLLVALALGLLCLWLKSPRSEAVLCFSLGLLSLQAVLSWLLGLLSLGGAATLRHHMTAALCWIQDHLRGGHHGGV